MVLLDNLSMFRSLWLMGRFGGGKTSLAVYLTLMLADQGKIKRIVTNITLNIGIEPTPVDQHGVMEITDSVMLIDEAWEWLGTGQWKEAKSWFAFLRKRNQYLLLPSVLPLTSITRVFRIERTRSLSQLGIPLWRYSWTIDNGELSTTKAKSYTWSWWYPNKIFPFYLHGEVPGDWRVYEL